MKRVIFADETTEIIINAYEVQGFVVRPNDILVRIIRGYRSPDGSTFTRVDNKTFPVTLNQMNTAIGNSTNLPDLIDLIRNYLASQKSGSVVDDI